MWIYTSKGMVSCVKHTFKANTILIRARTEEHIKNFLGGVWENKYFYLDNCDYNHRAEISVETFEQLLIVQARKVNYKDFKGSIPKEPEYNRYYKACHECWAAMNRLKTSMFGGLNNNLSMIANANDVVDDLMENHWKNEE